MPAGKAISTGFKMSSGIFSATRFVRLVLLVGFLVEVAWTPMQNVHAQAQPDPDQFPALPNTPGKDVLVRGCSSCHAPITVTAKGRNSEEWTEVLTQMVSYGMQASDEDLSTIFDYLATNFPPEGVRTNMNKATAAELSAQLNFSPKNASAIVSYRGKSGPFKSVDDVKKVPEIDAKVIESSRSHMVFQ